MGKKSGKRERRWEEIGRRLETVEVGGREGEDLEKDFYIRNNYLFTVLRFMVLNCPMIVSYSEIPLIVF